MNITSAPLFAARDAQPFIVDSDILYVTDCGG